MDVKVYDTNPPTLSLTHSPGVYPFGLTMENWIPVDKGVVAEWCKEWVSTSLKLLFIRWERLLLIIPPQLSLLNLLISVIPDKYNVQIYIWMCVKNNVIFFPGDYQSHFLCSYFYHCLHQFCKSHYLPKEMVTKEIIAMVTRFT